MKKTKDFHLNPFKDFVQCNIFHFCINEIKWGPDECSASDFALKFYWWCLGYKKLLGYCTKAKTLNEIRNTNPANIVTLTVYCPMSSKEMQYNQTRIQDITKIKEESTQAV